MTEKLAIQELRAIEFGTMSADIRVDALHDGVTSIELSDGVDSFDAELDVEDLDRLIEALMTARDAQRADGYR